MGHKQSRLHRQFRHQDIDDNGSLDFVPSTSTGVPSNSGAPLSNGTILHKNEQAKEAKPSKLKRGLSMKNLRRSFHVSSKKASIKRARKVAATTDDLVLPSSSIDCAPSSSNNASGSGLGASGAMTSTTPLPISTKLHSGGKLKSDTIVMDRLRRSFRNSFRRRKSDHVLESMKPHQWQEDEVAVRAGLCTFAVKYLGCVEVHESRGIHICEDALRRLRASRRRTIKGTLYVTGDGLRVVDEETKGLIVDQTIEKVSFCAPDRGHERGFSYICRDGATRRWMCHGFHAAKDTGERLSHSVGCAFTVCLERKQKRDKEAVQSSFDLKTATFTRTGSFRQSSITERMQDPQVVKTTEPPPLKQVHNPYAVERPHAAPSLLQRQGSLRGGPLNQASPFKRQLSLRFDANSSSRLLNNNNNNAHHVTSPLISSIDASKLGKDRDRAHSLDLTALEEHDNEDNLKAKTNVDTLTSFTNDASDADAENSGAKVTSEAVQEDPDAASSTITAMCQELSQGLTLLASQAEPELANKPEPSVTHDLPTTVTSTPNPVGYVSISAFEKWINTSANTVKTTTASDTQAVSSSLSSESTKRISPTNPFESDWIDSFSQSHNGHAVASTNPFLDLSQFASNSNEPEGVSTSTTTTNASNQMFKAFEVSM